MTPCKGTKVTAGGTALADALGKAKAGEVLCLDPGKHVGGLSVTRSVTLQGSGGAEATTLEGTGRGAVLHVEEDGATLRLVGLTITGGNGGEGGGLSMQAFGEVHVSDCVFKGNKAPRYGGGAIFANRGKLVIRDTRFESNDGNQGGALLLDQATRAEIKGATFFKNHASQGGAVRVKEGVEATFTDCRFEMNSAPEGSVLLANGTTTRAPIVKLESCAVLDGTITNDKQVPAKIRIARSRLPSGLKGSREFEDAGHNRFE